MDRQCNWEQNRNDQHANAIRRGAAADAPPAAPSGRAGRRSRTGEPAGGRARRGAGGGSQTLARAAVRLLEALCAVDAHAMPDPVDPERVLVRRNAERRAVSLSAGAFRRADADVLASGDLAAWDGAGRARRLHVTEAGRAWLRRSADPGDPFAAQHRTTAAATRPDPEDGTPRKVCLNAAESPLAWLAGRRNRDGTPFLDAASLEAGERFRRDLTMAGIMPGVTVDWSRFGGGGSAQGGVPERQSMTEALVAARQRIADACAALGAEDADLLVDVCGFLKGLSTIERERGWPARAGKMLLARALKRLAEHYGLAAQASGPARAGRIGVWRAPPG